MSRMKEKPSYCNEVSTKYLTKSFSKLLGLQANIVSHILKLSCLMTLHILAIDARKSDTQLKDIHIEIPYFGGLFLEMNGKDLIVKSFSLEDQFEDGIKKAVIEGKSGGR